MADSESYDYVTSTGLVVEDTSTIREDVVAGYQEALGSDISDDEDTPQGVLITAETLARAAVCKNNVALANQINPNQAEGVFLAAICALSAYTPPAATYSTLSDVTVTGTAEKTIPAGSRAKAVTSGNIFETTDDVTLDSDGSGTVSFQAVESGAIACAAGDLTKIESDVLGWETVTNPTAATLGTDALTDAEIRIARKATLAIQGTGTGASIESHLAALDGYVTHKFRENTTSSSTTVDDITLAANSVWVCVDGPSDADVGAALLASKSGGCAWNGSESVTVTDDSSGQSYEVLFDRPTEVPIAVKITVVPGSSSTDATSEVKASLLAYDFTLGESVSPFDLSGAVKEDLPNMKIKSLTIATVADGTFSTDEIELTIAEKATLASGNITVTVEDS